MNYKIYVDSLKNTYTYSSDIPLKIGSFCEVDFKNKIKLGLVIEKEPEDKKYDFKIKKITNILTDVPIVKPNILALIKFINDYYITDYHASALSIGPYENMSLERMKTLEEKSITIKNDVILNEEQESAYRKITESGKKQFLIHGITGSGKTQVYIKLIEQGIREGKGTIFLVPEITLTNQLVKDIKKVFGDNVSVIHSKITKAKKVKEWERIYEGKANIVIGARSAIFAPVKNLGYIIVDEEHENTYKQNEHARYHVRNVAYKRSELENAKLVLGSATPSFESYYLATKKNILELIELNNRFNGATLPEIEVVDLVEEDGLLSKRLLNQMKETLKKGEQIILFLNRKSHSLMVKCNECHSILQCPRCSVNLQYYKRGNILQCNHCEYRAPFGKVCNSCESNKLELIGTGVEKLEEELNDIFGKESIIRVDGSMTEAKIREAYNKFSEGEYSIMVGTQLIAKGFHFPNVTLVGIINSDQMLQLNDFRAGERTFQLVTQASGRAGRESKKGKVILQTYNKESKLVKDIIQGDYKGYFEYEMLYRDMLGAPPFKRWIEIIVSDKVQERCLVVANTIKEYLSQGFKNIGDVNPASIEKVKNEYRYTIYIKTDNQEIRKNRNRLKAVKDESGKPTRILVDIDPIVLN